MERMDFIADFSTIKNAYIEVKAFLEEETWDHVTDLSTQIENDLGCAGDDTYELLVKFTDRYNLNSDNFDFNVHFLSEGELFDAFTLLYYILIPPIWLIKVISSGKINLLPPNRYRNRETLDLTFGDMVVWYLAKEFKLRSNIHIQLPPLTRKQKWPLTI